MPILIGLDLGTTYAKAVALDINGEILATSACSYPMYTPKPGYAEQNPELVWQGATDALRTLTGYLHLEDIAGLCLSGAMHSCLPVARDGTPLSLALTWADQRASTIAQRLRNQSDALALYIRTGCPLQPIYHIPKLRWWVEQEPDIVRQAIYFVTIKDYVLFRLTGKWIGDISIYSATGLLDIQRYAWDAEALALAGVSDQQLIPIASPFTIAGQLNYSARQLTNLPPNIPIILGASDGGLANLGAGASQPGQSVITVGTSGAVRRIVAKPYLDVHTTSQKDLAVPQERTWCYILSEGHWFAGGAINNGGLAVQWVREKFYPELVGEAGYQQLFSDAAEIPPGSEGVTILPYFTGERSPYWNTEARATITGLGLDHDRRHIARAILEGVAYRLAEIWDALGTPDSTDPVRLTGGILQSSVWAQIVCDVIGTPLTAVETGDASAIGAAMLGLVSLGYAISLDSLACRIHPGVSWQPCMLKHAIYRNEMAKYLKLYSALYKDKVKPI